MEWCVFTPRHCQMSLSDVLRLQNQPVSEEQAWALCYQLCSLLETNFSEDLGDRFGPWKSLRLRGPEGVFFHNDGSISLKIDHNERIVMETEDQTVDYVGRLMYSCLDWGLEADVERELDQTLELLVSQMTKVDIRHGVKDCLQPICTITEVLQVCEERLYNPNQAAQHYRSVCATLFSHTIELWHYLQIIRQTKESLQKISMESVTNLVPNETINWNGTQEFVWKDIMEELSRGVVLRPLKTKPNTAAPLPVDTSPFTQLLQDIQLRRYTLRKVQMDRVGHNKPDPHQALLSVIRSGPKLRPVSERNLKPRVRNFHQELNLHELLMQEIRSADRMKLLSSCKRRPSYKGSGSDGVNLTFLPTLSSTLLSSTTGCRLSQRKRRSKSFTSSRDLFQLALKNKASVPATIADVIKMHYASEGKGKPFDTYRNWRLCSCCAKRSLHFTWHNFCSLCSGVICPKCCVEMRLPFKWCINLPLSFFKKIVLNKASEQSLRNFWIERWSWDPSWVPLVLEAHLPRSISLHSLAMRDWHSQDVCVVCQGLLLEACDTVQSHCPITDPQEI